jgi:hypothetical protein
MLMLPRPHAIAPKTVGTTLGAAVLSAASEATGHLDAEHNDSKQAQGVSCF